MIVKPVLFYRGFKRAERNPVSPARPQAYGVNSRGEVDVPYRNVTSALIKERWQSGRMRQSRPPQSLGGSASGGKTGHDEMMYGLHLCFA